jgi:hypothetical protein
MKILQMPCSRGVCMKVFLRGSWKVLVSRSSKSLSSSRSVYDDLVGFSEGSLHEDPGQDHLQFLVKRSCRDCWNRLRGPCQISYRSVWEDLVEILSNSSSRDPCIKILKMLCIGACVKVPLGCS